MGLFDFLKRKPGLHDEKQEVIIDPDIIQKLNSPSPGANLAVIVSECEWCHALYVVMAKDVGRTLKCQVCGRKHVMVASHSKRAATLAKQLLSTAPPIEGLEVEGMPGKPRRLRERTPLDLEDELDDKIAATEDLIGWIKVCLFVGGILLVAAGLVLAAMFLTS